MWQRWEAKGQDGRTIGHVQPEGYDAAATIVGAGILLLLGFGILYLIFAALKAIWNSGKLARVLITTAILAIALFSVAASDPRIAQYLVIQAQRYLEWARSVSLTPYPNTNLTIVTIVCAIALGLAAWLLWRPAVLTLQTAILALLLAVVMTVLWGFWLAVGQVAGVAIRYAAHWLLSGAAGSGLDFLQATSVCFLFAMPLALRKNGGYGHLRRRGPLFETLLFVGLLFASPSIGLWVLQRLGLMETALSLAMGIERQSSVVVSGFPPAIPNGAGMFVITTLLAGPVVGILLTLYVTAKRLAVRLAGQQAT